MTYAPPPPPPPPPPPGYGYGYGYPGGGQPPPVYEPPTSAPRGPRALIAVIVVVVALVAGTIVVITRGSHTSTPTATTTPLVARAQQSIVNINGDVPDGRIAGTGMVLTSDGYVLTNNHVIAGTSNLTGQIDGQGTVYQATVVGDDPTHDVAVIKLAGASGLPVIPIDQSGSVSVGDSVTAVGNALGKNGTPIPATGHVVSLDGTVAVSDDEGDITETLDNVIQVDALIQPGDSGGPLLNSNGQVIGMDTAGSIGQGSTSNSGVGAAIPITSVIPIADDIRAGVNNAFIQGPHRGAIGVSVEDDAGKGALVGSVTSNSAEQAGIANGDVITAVGDHPVTSTKTLDSALRGLRPGQKVPVTWVDTAGATHTGTVTLGNGSPP